MFRGLLVELACRLGRHDLKPARLGRFYCGRSRYCHGRIHRGSKDDRRKAREAEAEQFLADLAASHAAGATIYETQPRVRIPSTLY